jgi:hypothetical protein
MLRLVTRRRPPGLHAKRQHVHRIDMSSGLREIVTDEACRRERISRAVNSEKNPLSRLLPIAITPRTKGEQPARPREHRLASGALALSSPRSRAFAFLGFIHAQRTASQVLAVEALNGTRGISRGHLDESETARLAGIAIGDDSHRLHRSVLGEQLADLSLGSRKRQVSNVDLCHGGSSSPNRLQLLAERQRPSASSLGPSTPGNTERYRRYSAVALTGAYDAHSPAARSHVVRRFAARALRHTSA